MRRNDAIFKFLGATFLIVASAYSAAAQPTGAHMRPVEREISTEENSLLEGHFLLGDDTIRIQGSEGGHQFFLGSHMLASDIEFFADRFEYVPLSGQGRDYAIIQVVLNAREKRRCAFEYRVLKKYEGVAEMSGAFGKCEYFSGAYVDDRGILHVSLKRNNVSRLSEYTFAAGNLHWQVAK